MSSTVMVRQPRLSSKPVAFGNAALRFGLAIVLFWIGGMKFTAYEAAGIQPLIATSPLMSWLYRIFSVRATSDLIGLAELSIAVLILLRPLSPRVALAGGIGGTAMCLHAVIAGRSLGRRPWVPDARRGGRLFDQGCGLAGGLDRDCHRSILCLSC
jgi:reactive chlorine resistance protein C